MTDNMLPSLVTPHTTRVPNRKTEWGRNKTKPGQTRAKKEAGREEREEREAMEATPGGCSQWPQRRRAARD